MEIACVRSNRPDPWSSFPDVPDDKRPKERALTSAYPAWVRHVNPPFAQAELDAIRKSLPRGAPFGHLDWAERAARNLEFEHSLRSLRWHRILGQEYLLRPAHQQFAQFAKMKAEFVFRANIFATAQVLKLSATIFVVGLRHHSGRRQAHDAGRQGL